MIRISNFDLNVRSLRHLKTTRKFRFCVILSASDNDVIPSMLIVDFYVASMLDDGAVLTYFLKEKLREEIRGEIKEFCWSLLQVFMSNSRN